MMSFSVGRREEKMAKSVMRYERKSNGGVKGAGVGRGGAPQYRGYEGYGHHYHQHQHQQQMQQQQEQQHHQYQQYQHHHHYHHHQHYQVGSDGGSAFESSREAFKKATQVLVGRGSSGGGGMDKGEKTGQPMMAAQGGVSSDVSAMPVWTSLPKDLVEKVFAFLPLHSLFQARCVCKCWKNVGFSNNLVKLRAEAPDSPPYFPVYLSKEVDRRWCAYDHVQNKWLHLPPLTFLPKEAKHILAGDGGLLCLSESPSSALNFVCNPVTGTFKKVPSLSQDYEPGITHMVVNGKSHGFKMIVTLTHYLESTHVFESRQNSWQATSCLPPHFLLWGRRSSAFCKGFLYCVALEIGGMNMEGLIAYDVKSGVWTEVHELPRGMRDDPYVLSCGGRVLVVAAQKNTNGRLTSIRIVEFEPVSKRFLEVTEMPQNVMLDVFKCRGGWKPVAYGDRICVASKKTLSVAVYDMVRRSWHELPRCPLPVDTKVDVATFCYGPSLQSLQ
ncbi:hypothetical protein KC19_11G071600 [Ceratodon purpureus]|uniref:F-box domain-containing protein n=1 Tax=Ceratodon purpureus TaxID=3225 RepID=A0A8T0GHQ0_CERPU|nr:hypothetical protein KC19_11G071600 [Ceratodon purpureus]